MVLFWGMRRSGNAFTLVELMVVVAIICVLAILALPGFLRARQRTQNTKFIKRFASTLTRQHLCDRAPWYPPT